MAMDVDKALVAGDMLSTTVHATCALLGDEVYSARLAGATLVQQLLEAFTKPEVGCRGVGGGARTAAARPAPELPCCSPPCAKLGAGLGGPAEPSSM